MLVRQPAPPIPHPSFVFSTFQVDPSRSLFCRPFVLTILRIAPPASPSFSQPSALARRGGIARGVPLLSSISPLATPLSRGARGHSTLPLTLLFSALPYVSSVSLLSTAFTHFDAGRGVALSFSGAAVRHGEGVRLHRGLKLQPEVYA